MTRLRKSLTLKDLILQNIAAIVGFATLSLSAQFGWASLFLNLVVLIFFVFPAILMILDLSSRFPEEGGFYIWTKKAFGPFHGFLAAWSYWISNLVWFPSVLLSILTVGSFLFETETKSPFILLIIGLTFLWLVVWINILGLQKAKWIQNIGGIATFLTILLLTLTSLYYWYSDVEFSSIKASELIPDISQWKLFPFFAAITFSWAGIELSPVISEEVKDSKKTLPKALLIASLLIALIYILGTIGLLISTNGTIDEILGIPIAFENLSHKLSVPGLRIIGSLLVLLSFIGLFAAWLTGNARVPFVIGLDHFLPSALGKIHTRYHTPHISLIVQGAIITILFIGALAGNTVKEAFLVLVDMSIVLFFIPFFYMFLAFIRHQVKENNHDGLQWLTNNPLIAYVAAISGLIITGFTITMALIPSQSIDQPYIYYIKIIGGSLFLIGIGSIFYAKNQPEK